MTVTPAATQASRGRSQSHRGKARAPRSAAVDPLRGFWPEGETRAASAPPAKSPPAATPSRAEKEPPATKAATREARPGLGAPALGPLGGSSLTAERGPEAGGLRRKRKHPLRQKLPLDECPPPLAPRAFTLTGAWGPASETPAAGKGASEKGPGCTGFRGADWKPLGVPGAPRAPAAGPHSPPPGPPQPQGLGVWAWAVL